MAMINVSIIKITIINNRVINIVDNKRLFVYSFYPHDVVSAVGWVIFCDWLGLVVLPRFPFFFFGFLCFLLPSSRSI